MVRRQGKVSQRENPPYALDPSFVSYEGSEVIRTPTAAEKYALLEKDIAEVLNINPAELRRRFEDSIEINSATLQKIIDGDFGNLPGEINPWIWILIKTKEFTGEKVLRRLLNEDEFCKITRVLWVRKNLPHHEVDWVKLAELSESQFHMFRELESRPDFWSPHGRPDFIKMVVIKRRRS